jgi:hypothetical protein
MSLEDCSRKNQCVVNNKGEWFIFFYWQKPLAFESATMIFPTTWPLTGLDLARSNLTERQPLADGASSSSPEPPRRRVATRPRDSDCHTASCSTCCTYPTQYPHSTPPTGTSNPKLDLVRSSPFPSSSPRVSKLDPVRLLGWLTAPAPRW